MGNAGDPGAWIGEEAGRCNRTHRRPILEADCAPPPVHLAGRAGEYCKSESCLLREDDMRLLRGLGITLGAIIVIVALVGGYFGFVPGVSVLFGSDKPKDLGVTYTDGDWRSGLAKAGWEIVELPEDTPPEEGLLFSGQNPVDATFSERELTAFINPHTWVYYPMSDCQIRINDDATVELSGKLDTGRLQVYADMMDMSDEYSGVMGILQKWYIFGNPTFYVRISGAIYNGEITNARVHAQGMPCAGDKHFLF